MKDGAGKFLLVGFHRSAAFVFILTGFLKTLGVLAGHPILQEPDPLFSWFTRAQIAGGAAFFEVFVAIRVLREARPAVCAFLVAWVTSVFLAYRAGLWLIGYHGLCPCLGATLDAWTGGALAEDRITTVLLAYLAMGSAITWVWLRLRGERASSGRRSRAAAATAPFCLLAFILPLTGAIDASENRVFRGTIEWFSDADVPDDQPTRAWDFKAVSSASSWSVRTTQVAGDEPGRNDFVAWEPGMLLELIAQPGGGSGVVTAAQSQLVEMLRRKGVTQASVVTNAPMDSGAFIRDLEVPLYQPDGIQPLWLAFCSERHLAGRDRGPVQPVFDLGGAWRRQYPVVGIMEYLDRTRRLPSRVVFWNEGKVEDWEGTPSGSVFPLVTAPGPYGEGFTNAVFLVTGTTNCAGAVLPLRFSHDCYFPRKGARDAGDLLTLWRYRGRVSSIATSVEPAGMRPDFPVKLTFVMDQRIQHTYAAVQDARYKATNAVWVGEDKLAQLPSVRKRISRMEVHQQWSPVGWVLVLLVMVGFPAWARWGGWRRNIDEDGTRQS